MRILLSLLRFSYEDFESAVSNYDYSLNQGENVEGKIFDCNARGALVDIGAKAAAWLPAEEFATAPVQNPADYFTPDTAMEFVITSKEDKNGQLLLSLRRLEFQRCWDRVIQLQAEDVPVTVEIVSINRGGCLVTVEGLRGFIPQSHAGNISMNESEIGRKVSMIGESMSHSATCLGLFSDQALHFFLLFRRL